MVTRDENKVEHLEEIQSNIKIKNYTFAPDGKEVEELNLKEINKALKNKKTVLKSKLLKKVYHFIKKD